MATISKAAAKRMEDLAKTNPKLKAYWNEYGAAVDWDGLDGYKKSPTHGYIVLRWTDEEGVQMADLSYAGGEWDMQNDGFEPITEADWKKIEMVDECDWFVIPGNENFKPLS